MSLRYCEPCQQHETTCGNCESHAAPNACLADNCMESANPRTLGEIETVAELREWLTANMPGAKLIDTFDGLMIDTGLIVGMAGILESYPVAE